MLPTGVTLPVDRWLHTAVVLSSTQAQGTNTQTNQRMAIFGGVSYSGIILGDLWLLEPVNKTWTEAHPSSDIPILPREGHSAVADGGILMWVFGGISYGYEPFNDLWCYDASMSSLCHIDMMCLILNDFSVDRSRS